MTDLLRLYSVTSLIKMALGTSDALVGWAVGTCVEWAVDNRDAWIPLAQADRAAAVKTIKDSRFRKSGRAMARGTELHNAAEKLALGQQPEVSDEILPYVEQYRAFLADHAPEFLLSEAPVYNVTHTYAGTLDAIVNIAGTALLLDIKTTDRGPDSEKARPPYPETALQLCLYSRAELVGLLAERREVNYRRYYEFNPDGHNEPMPDVDGAAVLVVSPFDYQLIPVRIDDEVWRVCRAVLVAAQWNVDVSRRVFGPQITAKAEAAA